MKIDVKEFEEKMQKTITSYEYDLSNIRLGRATPAILQNVQVEYYGAMTAVNQMAEVKVTDPKTLVIQPWDMTTLKSIEKAILASDIGITPMNDGKVIRLTFPPLTEERRREHSKNVTKMGEECKVAVRNIRRLANDKCKAMKSDGTMTEDEQKASEKMIQDLTDKYIKEIDTITTKKQAEIMEV